MLGDGTPEDISAAALNARIHDAVMARVAEREATLQRIMPTEEWEKWQRVGSLDFPPRWDWPTQTTGSILVELTADEFAKFRALQSHSLTWLKYANTVEILVAGLSVILLISLPGVSDSADFEMPWGILGTLLCAGTWVFGGVLVMREIRRRIRAHRWRRLISG